jgi:5-methylcytosine-specific restriction protein B
LLQEYFFGDFGKAGLVLGEGFFEPREEADSELFADFNGYEALEFADRPVYRIKDILHMENEDFKKVIDTLLRKKDV